MDRKTTVFDKYTDSATLSKIVDYESVSEMWQESVKNYGDRIAIVDEKNYTYSDLEELVANFRRVLIENGVKKGDNVGVLLNNGIDFVKSFLAITSLGAVAVLLPFHLDELTVFGCSLKFSLSQLVYNDITSDKLSILKAKNPKVACVSATTMAKSNAPCEKVSSKEPCVVLFTGGTTGKSKGALLSNKAVMRGTRNGCYGYKDVFGERLLLVLPLTHVFGLIRNLLTTLYTGSTLFICKNNKDMFRDIAVFKPTILVLVPALAEMSLNLSKQFGKNMLGSDLKYIICGAAFVPPYLISEYKKLGVTLLAGYGLTESANLVSGNPESEKKPNSVGLFYPEIEYKIVENELWLKGPNMFDHYIGEDEENRLAFEDGYFKTGDLVSVDDDGFLYITGRKKEVIVLPSGKNVSPSEIENHFYEIDCVQDCLVYEDNGLLTIEVLPRAVVLKAQGIENATEYVTVKVKEVNEKLPSFMKINKIIIRNKDFARSPSMKILRGQNK